MCMMKKNQPNQFFEFMPYAELLLKMYMQLWKICIKTVLNYKNTNNQSNIEEKSYSTFKITSTTKMSLFLSIFRIFVWT